MTRDLMSKIDAAISNLGGLIIKHQAPVRKSLGYAIKKKRDGLIGIVNFSLAPQNIASLDKVLGENSSLMRYLMTIKNPLKEMRRIPITQDSKPDVKTGEKKADIEEIDQKLEEILKE